MPQGIIIKGIGGFYYVKDNDIVIECKVRGKFRNKKLTPMIGDNVVYETNGEKGVITDILQRRNYLVRPPVANIDQAILVISAIHPDPDLLMLDKIITFLEWSKINTIICINKVDLDIESNYKNIQNVYTNLGYNVICTSAKFNRGIEVLEEVLKDKVSTFAGCSGVGKSTLLNRLLSSANVQTGELSNKIERGKHTTRHVELFELENGGYILDTPGFSMFELEKFKREDIKYYFKEFNKLSGSCKFTGCNHIHEPACAVKSAVESDLINKGRYERYKTIFEQTKTNNFK